MSSSTVNKVVLKSNTTMTLSDRFGDIMKMKSPAKVRSPKAEQTKLTQASAKNQRLAEQMSRRTGIEPEATPTPKTESIKNRLGAAKAIPTKARLGTVNRSGGSPRARGINLRGRDVNKFSRGFSPRGRSLQNQQNVINKDRRASWSGRSGLRGRGRGRGGRGQQIGGRGQQRGGREVGGKASREDLDKELDSYMGVKKNHISFDSSDV